MGFPKITPGDTATIFIGSGALTYSWYEGVELRGIDHVGTSDDWALTFAAPDDVDRAGATFDGESTTRLRVDHESIMRAVRKIVDGRADGINENGVVRAECRKLIFKGADEVDFDAGTADCVIQVAAFGECIYS